MVKCGSNAALFYVGVNLQDILYGEFGYTHMPMLVQSHGQLLGVELYLYFKTMHNFLARRRARQKSDVLYAVFISVIFLLVTLWLDLVGVFEEWLTRTGPH